MGKSLFWAGGIGGEILVAEGVDCFNLVVDLVLDMVVMEVVVALR